MPGTPVSSQLILAPALQGAVPPVCSWGSQGPEGLAEFPELFSAGGRDTKPALSAWEPRLPARRLRAAPPSPSPASPPLQELLQTQDFSKFQALKPKLLDTVDDMLANDIARLMVMVRQEEALMPSQAVKGGAFEGTMNGPFGHGYGEGAGEGIDDVEWVVGKDKPTYDEIDHHRGEKAERVQQG